MYSCARKISSLISLVMMCLFFIGTTASSQGLTAEVGFFSPYEVAPGKSLQVPVEIRNASNVYGIDVTISFDPQQLQVVDADNATEGIQVYLGDFLDPGLQLYNIADNKAGTIRFVMTQVNPSEAKSGEGIVLLISFSGVNEGKTDLVVSNIELASREGVGIDATGVNSFVTVSSSAPTQASTIQPADSAGVIPVHTFTPTPQPTATPNPTLTPDLLMSTQELGGKNNESAPSEISPNSEKSNNQRSYWIVDNWWIIPVLIAVAIGYVIYLLRVKKSKEMGGTNEK